MYEVGMPATSPMYDCTVLVDTREPGRDTGLAVVNASEDTVAEVTIRLFDETRRQIAAKKITDLRPTFGPGSYLASYSTEIFPEIKAQGITRGVLTLESDVPIAAVTLRQTDNPSLSFPTEVPTMCAFPVIPGRTEMNQYKSAVRTLQFPHFVNGTAGGIQVKTSLLLFNPGRSEQSLRVEFIGENGAAFPIKGLGDLRAMEASLERGGILEIETTGQGELVTGYATVRAPADFGGTAVFTLWQNGVRLFEAGVPAVVPSRNQCIYLDRADPGRDIGLALANNSLASADVLLHLFDNAGQLKATRDLKTMVPNFGAQGHAARYASELFPEIVEQNIKGGIITVESTSPLSALTLRQHNPSQPFPADIFLLTTFPVIPILP